MTEIRGIRFYERTDDERSWWRESRKEEKRSNTRMSVVSKDADEMRSRERLKPRRKGVRCANVRIGERAIAKQMSKGRYVNGC